MSKRRGSDSITNQEMLAWAGMRGIRLLPLEIDALDALEDCYQTYQAKAK